MIDNTLSTSEKIHYTNLWCRQQGIKSADLGSVAVKEGKVKHNSGHDQIDDVILLTHVKTQLWDFMDNKQRGLISGLWGMVYKQKYPLKAKHIEKIQGIAQSIVKANKKKTILRQKIKALRSKTA
jgi:hypothetical protein